MQVSAKSMMVVTMYPGCGAEAGGSLAQAGSIHALHQLLKMILAGSDEWAA